MNPQVVPLKVENGGNLSLGVIPNDRLPLAVKEGKPPYSGPYSVTPSAQEQVLSTNGKTMTADIVVGAVPNNYGLITWNGSVLTVS